MAAITSATSAVVARPAFVGKTESLRARAVAPAAPKRASVVTLASADETSRRAALSVITVRLRRTRRALARKLAGGVS
jgi:photosystem II oxygen-evolving enhancer protein 2/Niemann-Pick C1 protein